METEQKFLSFLLGAKDTAVIALQQIIEVFQVSLGEICNVPQMPGCVLGIYNWRGEMLWLVDLEEMLGYQPQSQTTNSLTRMMAIVLQSEEKYLGILVRHLIDIESLDTQHMKSPDSQLFIPEISTVLKGYFINATEEAIISLDATAIIHSPLWTLHK